MSGRTDKISLTLKRPDHRAPRCGQSVLKRPPIRNYPQPAIRRGGPFFESLDLGGEQQGLCGSKWWPIAAVLTRQPPQLDEHAFAHIHARRSSCVPHSSAQRDCPSAIDNPPSVSGRVCGSLSSTTAPSWPESPRRPIPTPMKPINRNGLADLGPERVPSPHDPEVGGNAAKIVPGHSGERVIVRVVAMSDFEGAYVRRGRYPVRLGPPSIAAYELPFDPAAGTLGSLCVPARADRDGLRRDDRCGDGCCDDHGE